MKFLSKSKDGGKDSTVDAYWLVEVKGLFSVALLRFGPGSRSAYHSHAFHSVNWLLRGSSTEEQLDPVDSSVSRIERRPSLRPIVTLRNTLHRVVSEGVSWVLAVRGPWQSHWLEYDPALRYYRVLKHGRGVVQDGLDADEAADFLWLSPADVRARVRA